jgi:general secretion pathway protein A
LYGINNRFGFIELIGEVGTGKTTVLRTLLSQLDEEKYRTALIFNPALTALDLMRAINHEFGIPCKTENISELLGELNDFLLKENACGRTVVLIIDEAQNLPPALLEQVRLISNLETNTDKLIQIVLAGQPELGQILEKPELRQINQRIAFRYNLQPMDKEDTRGYIKHRVATAGGADKVTFAPLAIGWLYRYSRGTPRLINILCDRSLLIAYTEDKRKITARTVALAFRDVMLKSSLFFSPMIRKVVSFALLVSLLAIGGYFFRTFENVPRAVKPVAGKISEPAVVRPAVVPKVAKPVSTPKLMETAANLPNMQIVDKKIVGDLPLAAAGPPVTQDFKLTLRNELSLRSETKNAIQAFNALASFWHLPPLEQLKERYPLLKQIKGQAEKRHLELAPFKGKIDDLLNLDSPALLALSLKGTKGSYFVALTGFHDGKLLIQPSILGRNAFMKAEITPIWSGLAYIPWRNGERIPFNIGQGASGPDVIRLQVLLQSAGFNSLGVNGFYDESTVKAVRDFQASRNIGATGKVNPITLIQIYKAVNGASAPSLSKHGKGGGI